MKLQGFLVLISLLSLCRCLADPFQNMDFQAPNVEALNAIPGPHAVPVDDAIPGWTLYTAEVSTSLMYYNNVCITCAGATLSGPISPKTGDRFEFTIYSGFLANDPTQTLVSEAVAQIGTIPLDSKSLRFVGGLSQFEQPSLHVSVDGVDLPLSASPRTSFFVDFGADISQWAGKSAELRFTMAPGTVEEPSHRLTLRDISFSPEPLAVIPEPSVPCLVGAGLGVAFLNCIKRGLFPKTKPYGMRR